MNATKKNQPLVSVIIATFNCADTVGAAVESVIRQTYVNIELLVIDGGSKDGTLAELARFAGRIDRIVSETDDGIYDAWNKGVKLAGGEWICFIGADDVLMETAIEEYVRFIDKSGRGLKYVSSQVNLVKGNGEGRVIGEAWHWSVFRRFMNVAHVGSFHHRTLFQEYGFFDTSYKICGDYELLLRPKSRLLAGYFPSVTAKMAAGGISQSSLRLFRETYHAKISSGGRGRVASNVERLIAQLKWYIRVRLSWAGNLRSIR